MDVALAAYDQALQYDVAEVTTASTYRIAELYQDLSQALLNSERPRGLSGEALAQYDILLEEQAYPFEEKAIEIHEVNTRRTVEAIYDESVRRSFSRLAELLPVHYQKVEKYEQPIE